MWAITQGAYHPANKTYYKLLTIAPINKQTGERWSLHEERSSEGRSPEKLAPKCS